MFQHRDNFLDQHVNRHLIRNPELLFIHFRKDLFLSLAPTPGAHCLWLFGMLQRLGHLSGWVRNTLLIHTNIYIYIPIYILFVLLIPPTPQEVVDRDRE